MDASEAENVIRKWVRAIGRGYHPDTRGDGYSPPLDNPTVYDAEHEAAFAALGGKVYEVALSEQMKL